MAVTFNKQTKEWSVIRDVLPQPICAHRSTLEDNIIYIVGGSSDCKHFDPDPNIKQLNCINVKYNMNWQLIRLLWIAYYKQQQNVFAKLPKDIVDKISSFVGHKSIFETVL